MNIQPKTGGSQKGKSSSLKLRTWCLIIILAVICGYAAWVIQRCERQNYVIEQVRQLGGEVRFRDEEVFGSVRYYPIDDIDRNWLQKKLGDGYFRKIVYVSIDDVEECPAKLASAIVGLPNLKELSISEPASKQPQFKALAEKNPDLDIQVSWIARPLPMTELSTVAELRDALASDYVFLFINVEWQGTVQACHHILAQFLDDWSGRYPGYGVQFFLIDEDDFEDRKMLRDLVDTHSPRKPTWGSVLWIKDSVVVDHDSVWMVGNQRVKGIDFANLTSSAFIERTLEAFELNQ